MNIITLDFETYYDDNYTLKKLTTEAYVRDPRFEVLGCGVRWPSGEKQWLSDAGVPSLISAYDNCAFICHHAQFDGLILSHHYGIKPALWLDTLSMARLVVGNHLSTGLDSLARHFALQGKIIDYKSFKGKHWHELTPQEQENIANGCLHDVELTWRLFGMLAKRFPPEEYRVIDTTIRMFTEPVLHGDIPLLAKVWQDEEQRKSDSLASLGVEGPELQSADKFVALLAQEGIEVPTKKGKNGDIYCVAKTDDFMKELIEDDTRAGDLVRARLDLRSTIDQTRAERLGFMAGRGALPVYLRYCGAHTGRWAGGDNINWQNFPREGNIRKSIIAPDGCKLIILDLAQIECRMLNTIAGQVDVIDRFRRGEDPYLPIASAAYGRDISKADIAERGTGKQLELSCGYQAGAETIQKTAAKGLYGPPVTIDLATAYRWRDLYRSTHPAVVAYWGTCGRMIARLAGGDPLQWGVLRIEDGRLYAPNGLWIDYTSLAYDREARQWTIATRQGRSKLYGGKLTQNIMELLCRVILSQAMLRITALGYKIATCTHDEIVVVVASEEAEYSFEKCKAEMEKTPTWLPELPVKAEGLIAERYAK